MNLDAGIYYITNQKRQNAQYPECTLQP